MTTAPIFIRNNYNPPKTAPENSIHINATTGVISRVINGEWITEVKK